MHLYFMDPLFRDGKGGEHGYHGYQLSWFVLPGRLSIS